MGWSSVQFLESGDSYYQALLEEFRRAKKSILMESYIFEVDRVGREVLEGLCEAQGRGVKVFLRVDGIGSMGNIKEIIEFCDQRTLELEIFHPLPFAPEGNYFSVGFAKVDNFLTRWRLINRRTHRKLVIIDERVAFTGGRNVKEDQSERFAGQEAWHDLSLRLEGEGVDELVDAFWFHPTKGKEFKDCLFNYSFRLRQRRNHWLEHQIRNAKKRVWITTPYFAPTPTMLLDLRRTARRGVDVRFVFTRKIDVLVSKLAARGLYRRLLRWGVKVHEYEPRLLHRKMWVVDDLAIVGSANFNYRSLIHDLEVDVILRQPDRVAKAVELSLADQQDSRVISLADMKKVNPIKRFASWIAGWFTYWL